MPCRHSWSFRNRVSTAHPSLRKPPRRFYACTSQARQKYPEHLSRHLKGRRPVCFSHVAVFPQRQHWGPFNGAVTPLRTLSSDRDKASVRRPLGLILIMALRECGCLSFCSCFQGLHASRHLLQACHHQREPLGQCRGFGTGPHDSYSRRGNGRWLLSPKVE